MSTIEITKDNMDGTLADNDIVVLDCWASWCGPCRTFAPTYEAAATRHPAAVWGKLDTEAQSELAGKLDIRAIPTVMVFRQGILLFSKPGVMQGAALDEIIGKIEARDMDEVRKEIKDNGKARVEGRDNDDDGDDE